MNTGGVTRDSGRSTVRVSPLCSVISASAGRSDRGSQGVSPGGSAPVVQCGWYIRVSVIEDHMECTEHGVMRKVEQSAGSSSCNE